MDYMDILLRTNIVGLCICIQLSILVNCCLPLAPIAYKEYINGCDNYYSALPSIAVRGIVPLQHM